METSSRYAALEHLTDTEMVPSNDGNMPTPTARNLTRSLPAIRTTPHIQTQEIHGPIPQQALGSQAQHNGRGAYRGRGGRGGPPRRAAAEIEHTVVRGSRNGKQITTTVVHHQYDHPESSNRTEVDYDLLGEPPDLARVFTDSPGAEVSTMDDDTGQLGQSGPVL
nr:uncharacterized protein LOC109192823 [Ipomoea batatas]GME12993.1 uncharacterized protein LOC109192823 [Ipomoea batatas]